MGNRPAAIEVIEGIIESEVTPEYAGFLRQVIEQLGADASVPPQPMGPANLEQQPSDRGLLLELARYDHYLEALAKQDSPPTANPGLWSNRHAEMRRDPRFIAVMDRFGVVDLWHEIGPPPDCRAEGDSFTCGHGQEPVAFDLSGFDP